MIMYGKQVGGAELQFIELANYLADRYAVRLVSLGGDGSISAAAVDSRIDVKVYTYNGKLPVIPALMHAWIDCLRFKADAIVSTAAIGNILGYLISMIRPARRVSLQTVSKAMNHAWLDHLVLRRFDYLVAGADDIKHYLIEHGQREDNIKVVHNWVDFSKRTTSLAPAEAKAKFGVADKFVVGCVGRLHPQKGQIFLIRAFAKLVAHLPDSILLLAGDGQEKNKLEAEVAAAGLQERVLFLGEIKGDDYNAVYSAVDIYVQPSVFEGLPRTLLDAMFFGKPVIATDANGNREAIIHDANGLLVPTQDAEALYTALLYMIAHDEERQAMSLSAQRTVTERFEMQSQMSKIEQLLA